MTYAIKVKDNGYLMSDYSCTDFITTMSDRIKGSIFVRISKAEECLSNAKKFNNDWNMEIVKL